MIVPYVDVAIIMSHLQGYDYVTQHTSAREINPIGVRFRSRARQRAGGMIVTPHVNAGGGWGEFWAKKRRPMWTSVSWVPRTRLELAHPCEHQPLKLACLPISPSGQ